MTSLDGTVSGSSEPMKLTEIAARINAHLERFEANPTINPVREHNRLRTKDYHMAGAAASGSRLFVTFISYQGSNSLTKARALAYLEWLDAGNVGTIYEMERT